METSEFMPWLGRTHREHDEVSLGAVRRFAAMLDQNPDDYRMHGELPESWYAVLFNPADRQSALGADGHLRTGGFLPPLENRRRMFAGRRTKFQRPLHIGDAVERVSTIAKVEPKAGRTGAFVLVTVVHEIRNAGGVAVVEEQDIVYREAAGAKEADQPSKPAKQEVSIEAQEWSKTITIDPVLLFRYSALTFNSHRIHYDLKYTRDVEGYPGLVVNGGLTALLLVETARPYLRRRIAGYAARALGPLFADSPIELASRHGDDGTVNLIARSHEGVIAYRLDVSVSGP